MTNKTKVCIAGGRDFNDGALFNEVIDACVTNSVLPADSELWHIISGGALGADKLGENLAEHYNMECTVFKPNWKDFSEPCLRRVNKQGSEYNALAGMKRNTQLVSVADVLVAFWDGTSTGTKDIITKMREANKLVVVAYYGASAGKSAEIYEPVKPIGPVEPMQTIPELQHSDETTEGFRGEYAFLSNFCALESPIVHKGVSYKTVEHFYQAMKTTDMDSRMTVANHPNKGLKAYGRSLTLRENWQEMHIEVMEHALKHKFSDANPTLKAKLIATGDTTLIEYNTWKDDYWGFCKITNRGKNILGNLIMKIRAAISGAK